MKNIEDKHIFNSAFDVGLRVLHILNASNKSLGLQNLVYFDYFLIHSGEITDGPESIHPTLQFSSGEMLTRRELVKRGLHMMYSKSLITIVSRKEGIYYRKNKLTNLFLLNQHETVYAEKLKMRSEWINNKFSTFSEKKLQEYVFSNLGQEKTEIINHSYE